MNRREEDVSAVAREVVRFQQVTTDRHVFAFDFPDAPLRAEVDRDRVQQMLTNLVTNAIKYSPSGGEIMVGAKAEGEGPWVRALHPRTMSGRFGRCGPVRRIDPLPVPARDARWKVR